MHALPSCALLELLSLHVWVVVQADLSFFSFLSISEAIESLWCCSTCCPRSRVNKRIFKISLLSGSLLFSVAVVFIGCENKQTRGRRANKSKANEKLCKNVPAVHLPATLPSTGLVLLLPVARNTTLLQEGGGFCVDGCSVCLLTPAGAEPGAEGVAAGAGRRAAHRLARLRGHEEGRRSLRWAGLHAHSHMHSLLIPSLDCVSLWNSVNQSCDYSADLKLNTVNLRQ